MNNDDILRAIETIIKISDIESTKNYQELHSISVVDLLTAIEALQAQLKG